MPRRQRSKSERCQKFLFADFDDPLPAALVEDGIFERDCEKLVWPKCRIIAPAFSVDNVITVATRLVPKPALERFARTIGSVADDLGCQRACVFGAFRDPAMKQAERVIPERVDLNRFTPA